MSLRKQQSQVTQFTRQVNFCKAIPQGTTLSELTQRLNTTKQMFEEFKQNQDEVEETCGEDSREVHFSTRAQIEDYFFFCSAQLTEAINYVNKQTQRANNDNNNGNNGNARIQQQEVKLPRIELTPFSGRYEDWTSFKDLFTTLIHNNNSISNAQKLHYLKTNIKGTAYSLLKSINITDANYDDAWDKLTDRYNHKRYIVDSLLKNFFNQPGIVSENYSEIKTLIDKSSEIIQGLKIQGIPVNQWDAILVHVIVAKLDSETHKHWELKLTKDVLPKFSELQEFLEARWQSLEMISSNNFAINEDQSSIVQTKSSQLEGHKRVSLGGQNLVKKKCIFCSSDDHFITSCPKYLILELEARIQFIKSKNLCFNCLKLGHALRSCKSKATCQQCGRNHHTSIHSDKRVGVATTGQQVHSSKSDDKKSTSGVVQRIPIPRKIVMLATAVIEIYATSGEIFTVKALIDQGSEHAIIRSRLAKRLGLVRIPDFSTIKGIGDTVVESEPASVNFKIRSAVHSSFTIEVEAISMEKITGDLPSVPIDRKAWPHLQGLKLADLNFDKPSSIDVLLGAEVYEKIVLDGLIGKVNNSPTAQNSQLGWLLFGAVDSKYTLELNSRVCHLTRLPIKDDLDEALRKFWEIEEVPEQRKLTVKENQAEKYYDKTVFRTKEGRYTVSLPFDPAKGHQVLGESKPAAISCLFQMEKRFQKNQLLKERYVDYIKNLLKSGHIELVPRDRINAPSCDVFYLPHHAVLKEASTTTKLRVVFDASRKSSTGISLNDKLLVGPKIQDDLYSILIRWRKHEFVFISDAEKMFRQVGLAQNDRDFQRFLWRFNTNERIKEYRITTVIDGTASASFLATRTLKQLAEDGRKKFPTAAQVIKEDFYMDDVSSGSHSVESTIQLQNDLIKLMKGAGFNLRKWLSNNQQVLENIPVENRQDTSDLVELMEESVKTLGVYWNPKDDCFEFKISPFETKDQLTKRQLLSEISKLFDPIGWLSPTTIVAKTFMQSLWSLKELDWDDKVPEDRLKFWRSYRNQLNSLEKIKIPRWIGTEQSYEVQLHGFGDASNSAYAAVVYSRVILSDGSKVIRLISAKTKVAPVKVISTPKLELCGAVLVARLMFKVMKSFNFNSVKLFNYSDNTTVLAWLKSHPNHWNTFVANRVTEIQTLTNPDNWYFVDTENNPADCASRGVFPSKLREHSLWWNGPTWLSKDENDWPEQPQNYITDLEKRKMALNVVHVRNDPQDAYLMEVLKKHSSLVQLQRRTAYILRCHSKSKLQSHLNGKPTATELGKALNGWIRYTQSISFPDEVARCKVSDELPNSSKLQKLRPYMDENGILRVGGRISKSHLPIQAKHPIILPKRNYLTSLVINQAHQLTLHGGPTLMSSFLSNYWIFGKADEIKRTIKSCRTCFTFRCKPQGQIMADLPKSRVTPNRSFLHTGVDFAGPLITKAFTGRSRGRFANPTTKSYIAIFICLVTKAVHIELVSDLSSKTFKAAFDRFSSRKGKVTDMYSDCGTNFVAANKELRDQFTKLMKDENLQGLLAQDGTTWHFNPPASPHFGGLWEAGVKSIKYHLKRLVGNNTFTFEEMTTLLCKIEACLNSRPLCPMSDDINDVSYLTPGHFTIGEPPIVIPEQSYLESNVNRLSRWQLIQRILQQFWNIWSSEYLSRLQQRPKWNQPEEDVRVGQLVLLREDNTPPSKWPIARILEVHPGSDDKVRVVTLEKHSANIKSPVPEDLGPYLRKLKTHKSVLVRPVHKISVLPIEDNEKVEFRANLIRRSF